MSVELDSLALTDTSESTEQLGPGYFTCSSITCKSRRSEKDIHLNPLQHLHHLQEGGGEVSSCREVHSAQTQAGGGRRGWLREVDHLLMEAMRQVGGR